MYQAKITYTFGLGPCFKTVKADSYRAIVEATDAVVASLCNSYAYSLGKKLPVIVQTVRFDYPSGKSFTKRF